MPPQPYQYQGAQAIARFILHNRATRDGANLTLVLINANHQPAFGCYLPDQHAPVARASGLMVVTLAEELISAITWFGDPRLFPRFGLPLELPR